MSAKVDFIKVDPGQFSGEMCAICRDDIVAEESLNNVTVVAHRSLLDPERLEHPVHLNCINLWVKRKGTCPLDRNQVASIDGVVLNLERKPFKVNDRFTTLVNRIPFQLISSSIFVCLLGLFSFVVKKMQSSETLSGVVLNISSNIILFGTAFLTGSTISKFSLTVIQIGVLKLLLQMNPNHDQNAVGFWDSRSKKIARNMQGVLLALSSVFLMKNLNYQTIAPIAGLFSGAVLNLIQD